MHLLSLLLLFIILWIVGWRIYILESTMILHWCRKKSFKRFRWSRMKRIGSQKSCRSMHLEANTQMFLSLRYVFHIFFDCIMCLSNICVYVYIVSFVLFCFEIVLFVLYVDKNVYYKCYNCVWLCIMDELCCICIARIALNLFCICIVFNCVLNWIACNFCIMVDCWHYGDLANRCRINGKVYGSFLWFSKDTADGSSRWLFYLILWKESMVTFWIAKLIPLV